MENTHHIGVELLLVHAVEFRGRGIFRLTKEFLVGGLEREVQRRRLFVVRALQLFWWIGVSLGKGSLVASGGLLTQGHENSVAKSGRVYSAFLMAFGGGAWEVDR